MNKTTIIFCLFVSLFFLAGCQSKTLKTEPVSGTVTLDDTPLEGATVMFSPIAEGHPSYGSTDTQGFYRLQTLLGAPDAGTTPGEYKVFFSKLVPVHSGRKIMTDNGRVDDPDYVESLPESYSNRQKVTLTATVVAGNNQFDFQLKSKAK